MTKTRLVLLHLAYHLFLRFITWTSLSLWLFLYIYTYMYICMYVCVFLWMSTKSSTVWYLAYFLIFSSFQQKLFSTLKPLRLDIQLLMEKFLPFSSTNSHLKSLIISNKLIYFCSQKNLLVNYFQGFEILKLDNLLWCNGMKKNRFWKYNSNWPNLFLTGQLFFSQEFTDA